MLRAVHDVSSDPIELNGPTAARYRGKAFQTPPPLFLSCCAPMKCTEAFGPFIHRMNTKSEEQNIRMLLNARLDD
jgi:hypothetical protein